MFEQLVQIDIALWLNYMVYFDIIQPRNIANYSCENNHHLKRIILLGIKYSENLK